MTEAKILFSKTNFGKQHNYTLRTLLTVVMALAYLVIQPRSSAQTPPKESMSWPQATAQLAKFKTTGETCVSLIKQFGGTPQKAQARLLYGDAKANTDSITSGLTTALFMNGDPASLPTLQSDLTSAAADLSKLCSTATTVMPSTTGHKGVVDDIAKAAIEPLVKAVSDGIAALYNNHRADKDIVKKTIQTQLEAAKWSDFDKVSSGH